MGIFRHITLGYTLLLLKMPLLLTLSVFWVASE